MSGTSFRDCGEEQGTKDLQKEPMRTGDTLTIYMESCEVEFDNVFFTEWFYRKKRWRNRLENAWKDKR